VAAPPFFPNAGKGTVRFWGNEQGPAVFLWDGLDEEGREECERAIQTRKDWVVWSRVRQIVTQGGPHTQRFLNTWEKLSNVEKLNEARNSEGSLKQNKGRRIKHPIATLT